VILTLDLLAALSTLTPMEREVLIDHCVLGDSYDAIAQRHGYSRSNCQLIEKRATGKLRAQLAGRERPSAYEMLAAA
jgi:DNA-directed RNA polymerase specialized sigma24 family protein